MGSLRIDLLQYVEFEQFAKLGLLCKVVNKFVDPNFNLISTDRWLNVTNKEIEGQTDKRPLNYYMNIVFMK